MRTNTCGFHSFSWGRSDIPVADGTDGVTFGVRLYETSPNAWSAVAVELAPTNQLLLQSSVSPVPISIANIHSIGMISSSLLPPYIDNFTLDVTPRARTGNRIAPIFRCCRMARAEARHPARQTMYCRARLSRCVRSAGGWR